MSGIYIHIPFCRTHCTYCGFYSELLRTPQGSESFVSALCSEIAEASPVAFRSEAEMTLYFGGGTPSLLSLEQISRIVKTIGIQDFSEFTMEVNPDDIVKNGMEYTEGLKKLGVNRISMGVQSFDDAVLKRMGRRHNAAEAVTAYGILREAGFENISLDFIFGFVPGMSARDLGKALESLPGGIPEHLSCYQLSIEEGSGLEKMVQRGIYVMPSDEECERQYYDLCAVLRDMGYEHYEISSWARPGRRSRHNSSYWDHTPYIGFGPGAHSLFVSGGNYVRRWNNPDLSAYIEAAGKADFSTVRGSETLTEEQIEEERIMLGLRTSDGIPSGMLKNTDILVPSAIDDYIRIPEGKWFVSDSIITNMI